MRRMNALWRCCTALALTVVASATPAADYALLTTPAPDFALKAFAGVNVRLSEHRGEVVVLSFWSSRCGPCTSQLSALDQSFKTYESAGLKVYGISVDDDKLRAQEFAKARPVGFTMLSDPDKDVSRRYRVDNLPMAVLIDRSGVVRHVYRDFSARSEALYLQDLRALLNE